MPVKQLSTAKQDYRPSSGSPPSVGSRPSSPPWDSIWTPHTHAHRTGVSMDLPL